VLVNDETLPAEVLGPGANVVVAVLDGLGATVPALAEPAVLPRPAARKGRGIALAELDACDGDADGEALVGAAMVTVVVPAPVVAGGKGGLAVTVVSTALGPPPKSPTPFLFGAGGV